jgi:signal peptidase I
MFKNLSNSEYNVLNAEEKSKLIKKTDSISNSYFIFPYSRQNKWTRDDYGKLIIPKKGQTITISQENYDCYKTIIKNYELAIFQLEKGEQKTYTFKNDYYFMLGDNRHNSIDSRSYGFVPENYIQGKMILKF